jgi:hypothetical protein
MVLKFALKSPQRQENEGGTPQGRGMVADAAAQDASGSS